jgi:aspartate/methionine/tyrosine aminotransferase
MILREFVLIFGVYVAAAQAQAPIQLLPPKTRLEALETQSGRVIIRGFSKSTEMRGARGGHVIVQNMELTDAMSGTKQFGMVIDVVEGERSNRSFVDYDEIGPLLKALDYLTKVDRTVTQLDGFRADYRTRGDFVVSVFSSPGGRSASISGGFAVSISTMYIRETELPNFREIVANAKAQLDSLGAR